MEGWGDGGGRTDGEMEREEMEGWLEDEGKDGEMEGGRERWRGGEGGREGEMEEAVQEGCRVLVCWKQSGAALTPPPQHSSAPHSLPRGHWVPTNCAHSNDPPPQKTP